MAARGVGEELRDIEDRIDALTSNAARLEDAPKKHVGPKRFQRVLVAIDDDASQDAVLSWAHSVAKAYDAHVRLVHVVLARELLEFYSELGPTVDPLPLIRKQEERAQALVKGAREKLKRLGTAAEAVVVPGYAAEGLLDQARRWKADLVILGSHSRGPIGRRLLGSVVESVKNRLDASLLIARTKAPSASILIAADGSSHSKRAAGVGIRLKHAVKAKAHIVHVLDPFVLRWLGVSDADVRDIVRHRDLSRGPGVTWELRFGSPAQTLLKAAKAKKAGLVVLGSRGLGNVEGRLMGSVSSRVVSSADASVLVVRE